MRARNRRGVALLAALWLVIAIAAVAAQFAIEAAQGVERGLTGVLRLSFVPSAALDFLPGVLQRFQAAYPSLRLVLTAETTRKEIEALHAQSVDAAIIVPPLADTTGLDITVLRTATMVLAVPGNHRLAGRKSIALSALSREAFMDTVAGHMLTSATIGGLFAREY